MSYICTKIITLYISKTNKSNKSSIYSIHRKDICRMMEERYKYVHYATILTHIDMKKFFYFNSAFTMHDNCFCYSSKKKLEGDYTE